MANIVGIVIAEDNPLLRDGIALILTQRDAKHRAHPHPKWRSTTEHGMDVAESVDNGTDLLTAVGEHRPDLAFVRGVAALSARDAPASNRWMPTAAALGVPPRSDSRSSAG